MRNAGLFMGRSAVGVLAVATLISFVGAAHAAAPGIQHTVGGLKPAEVGRALAGEWEGQIQVRSVEGKLSTAPASMSARLSADKQSVELYYEGFAFGQPVEGAMVFHFDSANTEASLRDDAVNLQATCRPQPGDDASEDAYQMSCERESPGEFRVVFSRLDQRAWNIAYQSREGQGEWEEMLSLQLDRLGSGQRSAAADGFDRSPLLGALRTDSAVASVETEE
ncbi:MAG: hypothetical protein IT431_11180 [Phycisphaerales bacterium]|nr:hypothetical protein [Phycisphaerales bacterium]